MMFSKLLNPFSKAVISFALIAMLSVLLIWLLNPVIIPVLVSLVLYICLSPLHNYFRFRGLGSDASALLILLFILFMILVPGSLILSAFNQEISQWQSKASMAGENLNAILAKISELLAQWQFKVDSAQLKTSILSMFSNGEQSFLASVSQLALSISSSLLLVPFITFFLLRDFSSLRNKLLNALPNKYFELGWLMYFKVANQTEGYVRAVLIQQSILATVASLGFYLCDFPSPIILGVIAGLLGLIPYLGPLLGLIPPIYLVLAEQPINYDSIYAAVLVIGVAYILDNVFVIPLIVARFANLHPLVALLGIIIFGNFFGILGMMAAIPLMAISNIIFSQLLLSFNPKKFSAILT